MPFFFFYLFGVTQWVSLRLLQKHEWQLFPVACAHCPYLSHWRCLSFHQEPNYVFIFKYCQWCRWSSRDCHWTRPHFFPCHLPWQPWRKETWGFGRVRFSTEPPQEPAVSDFPILSQSGELSWHHLPLCSNKMSPAIETFDSPCQE